MIVTCRSPRELGMAAAYLSGATLQQIGEEYGIGRERVRQLLRRNGVPVLRKDDDRLLWDSPKTARRALLGRWVACNVRLKSEREQARRERTEMIAFLQQEAVGLGRAPRFSEVWP